MTDPSSEDSDGQYNIDKIRDNQAVAFGTGAQASVTNIIHKPPPPPPDWPLFVSVPARPNHFVGRQELIDDFVAQLCGGIPALAIDGLP